MSQAGAVRTGVGALLVLVLAGLGLVLVASHTTPSGYRAEAPASHYSFGPAAASPTRPAPSAAREPDAGVAMYPALALIVVEVLALLALIVLLVGWLLRLRIRRRSRAATRSRTADPQVLVRNLVEAADQSLDELTDELDGPTHEVIIACWLRLRDAAVSAGVELRAADSPAEFIARIRGATPVPSEPLERLARLFREARFSKHEMTSADRTSAVQALLAIRAALAGQAQHA